MEINTDRNIKDGSANTCTNAMNEVSTNTSKNVIKNQEQYTHNNTGTNTLIMTSDTQIMTDDVSIHTDNVIRNVDLNYNSIKSLSDTAFTQQNSFKFNNLDIHNPTQLSNYISQY